MAATSDLQILNAQLRSVLEAVNKALPESQAHILEGEIQKTINNLARVSSSSRGKGNRCDGTNCNPTPASSKSCTQVPESEISSELLAGKYMCETCSQWIALSDENVFTLTPWLEHLLVCEQSKLLIPSSEKTRLHAGAMAKSVSRDQSLQTIHSPATSSMSTSVPAVSQPSPQTSKFLNEVTDNVATTTTLSITERDTTSDVPQLQVASATDNLTSPVSKKRRRPNRTEAERIDEFLNDPAVAEVEPYRVLCALCNKWIKLRKNSRYCPIPWNCHKGSCEKTNAQRPGSRVSSKIDILQSGSSYTARGVIPSLTPPLPQPPNSSITHPSLSASRTTLPNLSPSNSHLSARLHVSISPQIGSASARCGLDGLRHKPRQPHRTRLADAELRRAALEADTNSEIVERDRILCALCRKWVKLRPNSSYCAAPWQSHIRRCADRHKKRGIASPPRSGPNIAPSELTVHVSEDFLSDTNITFDDGVALDPDQDGTKSNHYRVDYDNRMEESSDERRTNASSYYKNSFQPSSTSRTLFRKRRGRPPGNKMPEPKAERPVTKSDSEVSYESEEA